MDELYQGLYDLLATDDLHQQVDGSPLEATFEKVKLSGHSSFQKLRLVSLVLANTSS
jgi:hypothetical protein